MENETILWIFGAFLTINILIFGSLIRAMWSTQKELIKINIALTGMSGENGIIGDIKTMRGRWHRLYNWIHVVQAVLLGNGIKDIKFPEV